MGEIKRCAIEPVNGHVNWPSERKTIEKYAFKCCTKLKTIYIPPGVLHIHPTAFLYSGLNLFDLFNAMSENKQLKEENAALKKNCLIHPSTSPAAGHSFSPSGIPSASHSFSLSMAYAGYLFTENVIRGLNGEKDVVQCAYVQSDITDADYFASPCRFGKNGVEEVLPFGKLSDYEQMWFDKMMPDLNAQIQKGKDFVNN